MIAKYEVHVTAEMELELYADSVEDAQEKAIQFCADYPHDAIYTAKAECIEGECA